MMNMYDLNRALKIMNVMEKRRNGKKKKGLSVEIRIPGCESSKAMLREELFKPAEKQPVIEFTKYGVIINKAFLIGKSEWNAIIGNVNPKCLCCNTLLVENSVYNHIATEEHVNNLNACSLKGVDFAIRKINEKLHCMFCNEIISVKEPYHCKTEDHVAYKMEASNRASRIQRNDLPVAICEDYYDNSEVNEFLDGDYLFVTVCDTRVKVRYDTWHMLNIEWPTAYCALCNKDVEVQSLKQHCLRKRHVENLRNCGVYYFRHNIIIRRIHLYLHCSHCNKVKSTFNVFEHVDLVLEKRGIHQNIVGVDSVEIADVSAATHERHVEWPLFDFEENDCILVRGFRREYYVSVLSFNMVRNTAGNCTCALCEKTFQVDKAQEHVHDPGHVKKLVKIPFFCEREINIFRNVRQYLHCIFCNIVLDPNYVMDHINDPVHFDLIRDALLKATTCRSQKQKQNNAGGIKKNPTKEELLEKLRDVIVYHISKYENDWEENDVIKTKVKRGFRDAGVLGVRYANKISANRANNRSKAYITAASSDDDDDEIDTSEIHGGGNRKPVNANNINNVNTDDDVEISENDVEMSILNLMETELTDNIFQSNSMERSNKRKYPKSHKKKSKGSHRNKRGNRKSTAHACSRTNTTQATDEPQTKLVSNDTKVDKRNKKRNKQISESSTDTKKSATVVDMSANTIDNSATIIDESTTVVDNSADIVDEPATIADEPVVTNDEPVTTAVDPENIMYLQQYVIVKMNDICAKMMLVSYNSLVETENGLRHCFVCSTQLLNDNMQTHADSANHLQNLDDNKFIDKYDKHFIRQILSSYHCALCNVILEASSLSEHLQSADHVENETNSIITKTDLNAVKNGNRKTPKRKQSSKKTARNGNCSELREIVVGTQKETYYSTGEEPQCDVAPKVNQANLEIAAYARQEQLVQLNGEMLKINWLMFHGLNSMKNGIRCFLCRKGFKYSDISAHVESPLHVQNMAIKNYQLDYAPALMRKIKDSLYCVTCNSELPNTKPGVNKHVKEDKHENHYNAVKYTARVTSDTKVLVLKGKKRSH